MVCWSWSVAEALRQHDEQETGKRLADINGQVTVVEDRPDLYFFGDRTNYPVLVIAKRVHSRIQKLIWYPVLMQLKQ
jgi:hypothetical protein